MSENPRILLVDDEPSVLNALQRFFRRAGYSGVITCTSGREGLELLERSGPVELVVSDYRMPEMNGVEFLSAVRARWPDTVRMVLSGYADTSAIIAATNEGNIYKFISKPWDEDFLLQSVEQALKLYTANRRKNEQLQLLGDAIDKLDALHSESLANQSLVLSIYHTLFDQMPVGVIGIDRDCEIVSMNESARQTLGLAFAPLGEPAEAVLPGICGCLNSQLERAAECCSISVAGKKVKIITKKMHAEGSDGVMLILVLLEGGAEYGD